MSLSDLAKLVTMTEVSFSRFIKKRTGISFVDSFNEIRLGHASHILIDTTKSIAVVPYNYGFNNISNFNRLFRSEKFVLQKNFVKIFQLPEPLFNSSKKSST